MSGDPCKAETNLLDVPDCGDTVDLQCVEEGTNFGCLKASGEATNPNGADLVGVYILLHRDDEGTMTENSVIENGEFIQPENPPQWNHDIEGVYCCDHGVEHNYGVVAEWWHNLDYSYESKICGEDQQAAIKWNECGNCNETTSTTSAENGIIERVKDYGTKINGNKVGNTNVYKFNAVNVEYEDPQWGFQLCDEIGSPLKASKIAVAAPNPYWTHPGPAGIGIPFNDLPGGSDDLLPHPLLRKRFSVPAFGSIMICQPWYDGYRALAKPILSNSPGQPNEIELSLDRPILVKLNTARNTQYSWTSKTPTGNFNLHVEILEPAPES